MHEKSFTTKFHHCKDESKVKVKHVKRKISFGLLLLRIAQRHFPLMISLKCVKCFQHYLHINVIKK